MVNTCCGTRISKPTCGKAIKVKKIEYGVEGRVFKTITKYVQAAKCVSYSGGRQVICGGCSSYACLQCKNNKLTCNKCCKKSPLTTCFA